MFLYHCTITVSGHFNFFGDCFILCETIFKIILLIWLGAVVGNPSANAGDTRDAVWIPGPRKSSGGGLSNQLEYYCPENPMDRGAWWATVHGVVKSQTWLKWLGTIYLTALDLSCNMWDLVPQPGIEPGSPALAVRSLSHWTTREVSVKVGFNLGCLFIPVV